MAIALVKLPVFCYYSGAIGLAAARPKLTNTAAACTAFRSRALHCSAWGSRPSLQQQAAASSSTTAAPAPGSSASQQQKKHYSFVVVGGGTGGLAVASSLGRRFGKGSLAVIEPSEYHYYQPMWTLVGAGVRTLEDSRQLMSSVMPPQAHWIKSPAAQFIPTENTVVTEDGGRHTYDYLIVALGLKVNFNKVHGLVDALEDPESSVSSNYSAKYVTKTFENLKAFKGGTAIFTFPTMPIKCPGAPQKIMYLADDYWRQQGVRDKTKILYNTSLGVIFGVKKYANRLMEVVARKGIQLNFQRNLVEVDHHKKEAVFQILDEVSADKRETYKFDFMHVSPPMCSLKMMKGSPIADKDGWVDVNKETLQHKNYDNIFGIGDCTNVPTSKTAAACAAESKVLRNNLLRVMKGETPVSKYDGYTSCPLITGFGKTIMAEFDFNAMPLETFPFDQGQERKSMYYMKRDVLPSIYWNGLVRGLWGGPGTWRKILHLGMSK